ncbi:MAG TPA: DinB family protein [Propionibacteriaceae bacterium]|nr:DinB family protein [Propionibacteriaceae bacterium]
MTATDSQKLTADDHRCGCCGQRKTWVAELGATPGVYICRRCALWAVGRAAPGLLAKSRPVDGDVPRSSNRQAIHDEMEQACVAFRQLVAKATKADLARQSAGTRWTNRQLLFHMLFGYLVVLRLLPLVRVFGRLPDAASRVFASALESATKPYHMVNYLGSYGGGTVITPERMVAWLDRVAQTLHQRLDAETEDSLQRRMHFPVDWDPFFKDTMTLEDVYRFGTQHFEYHRAQLTLGIPQG